MVKGEWMNKPRKRTTQNKIDPNKIGPKYPYCISSSSIVDVYNDKYLHQYIIDFACCNLSSKVDQEMFLKDVWCDIGRLANDHPSMYDIALIAWRRVIRYEPIMALLADGYTEQEIADSRKVTRQAISKKRVRFYKKRLLK